MAAWNAASFAFDGLLKPLTLRTNCNEAARISSSVTGGAKLKRILMFLHISFAPMCDRRLDRHAALQGIRRILTRAPAGSASRPSGAPDVHWTGGKRVIISTAWRPREAHRFSARAGAALQRNNREGRRSSKR